MRAIDHEIFRAAAVEYGRFKEKPCWIVLAEQRQEAEINIAEILKNGWAGSRLEFKNGTKTNPQGFWEYAAKALKCATGDTGEPQDGQPKEWTARALYIWLRRKKDSGKFTKRVAAKWGLGEEQFHGQEAWKTTWESIRANIIKFKWRLLNKVLPTSDRLSRQGLVDAVRNCPLCGICRETVEHMFFSLSGNKSSVRCTGKQVHVTNRNGASNNKTHVCRHDHWNERPAKKRDDIHARINAFILNMGNKK